MSVRSLAGFPQILCDAAVEKMELQWLQYKGVHVVFNNTFIVVGNI